MSDTPITSRPSTVTPPLRKATSTSVVAQHRPSYTYENAEKWKPTFDELIATKMMREVLTADTGLRTSTLYLNAQDSLKWLCDNSAKEEDKQRYSQLRNQIKITKLEEGGIRFVFKATIGFIASQPAGVVINNLTPSWISEFESWLLTAQSGDLFEKNKIRVSKDEHTWLMKMLAPLEGVELEVTETSVKIMR